MANKVENKKYRLKGEFHGKFLPKIGGEGLTLHNDMKDFEIEAAVNKGVDIGYFEDIKEASEKTRLSVLREVYLKKSSILTSRSFKKNTFKVDSKIQAIIEKAGVAKSANVSVPPSMVKLMLKGGGISKADVTKIYESKNSEELAANKNFAKIIAILEKPEDTTGEDLFKFLGIGQS